MASKHPSPITAAGSEPTAASDSPHGTDSSGGVARERLLAFLEELFREASGKDYCPNGLQVEGTPQIRKVITAVSACQELFQMARQRRADAILVHHGIFWNGMSSVLTGMQYRRVRELMSGDLNLIAYHLPLDRHPELGNNALAARALGLGDLRPFAPHQGLAVGFMGTFDEAIDSAELIRRSAELFGQQPLAFESGPRDIRRLGIVSGGAQKELYAAIDEGLDAFITGEVSEWVMNVARESGIHYLAAGHYATERLGIRRLGEVVAETFDLDVEFIDIPNPA